MKVDWKRKSLKRRHLAKNQSVQLFCTSFTNVKHWCLFADTSKSNLRFSF